jgi:hypothetical protein
MTTKPKQRLTAYHLRQPIEVPWLSRWSQSFTVGVSSMLVTPTGTRITYAGDRVITINGAGWLLEQSV